MSGVGRVMHFFFLVPSVFSSNTHLVISHQKKGRAAACLEARSIMIFLPCLCTGSSEWVLFACQGLVGLHSPSSFIRAPPAPCTALQSRSLGADFQKDWAKPVSSSSLPSFTTMQAKSNPNKLNSLGAAKH